MYSQILSGPQKTTMALLEYANLAVNCVPEVLNVSNRFVCPMRIFSFMNYIDEIKYIISPFNNSDIDKIKGHYSYEELWKDIFNRNDFKNLIVYVQENNINDNVTKIDISETYKKFIEDILNTVRNNLNNNIQ